MIKKGREGKGWVPILIKVGCIKNEIYEFKRQCYIQEQWINTLHQHPANGFSIEYLVVENMSAKIKVTLIELHNLWGNKILCAIGKSLMKSTFTSEHFLKKGEKRILGNITWVLNRKELCKKW